MILKFSNFLEFLHLRSNVVVVTPEPGECLPGLTLSASPHEPDRGLGQQPAEQEEEDTEDAQGGVVEVEGDDQANAETQEPAQAGAALVKGGQRIPVADEANL